MSAHGYDNNVGATWRDTTLTRAELTVQQIAEYGRQKRVILSSTLWGRYMHRGRHHHPNIFQRIFGRFMWTPSYS